MTHNEIAGSEPDENSAINTKNISILYVDDEKENLRVLNLLMRRKFKIFVAQNASEAFSILSANTIHVILSDVKMDGMNGTELLKKVGENYPNIIKMLLTGDDNQISVRNAMKHQDIFACVNKPFDRKGLEKLFVDGFMKLVNDGYASLLQ
ncbi:MAG: response regulator [Cyclobacteriaceae bacterium]